MRRIELGTIRWDRVAFGTLAGLFALLVVGKGIRVFGEATAEGRLGFDVGVYTAIARQYFDTGALYAPFQLTGPYPDVIYSGGWVINLYPPPMLLLFAPFTVLPGFLFAAIPLAIFAAVTWYWRPAPYSWPIITGVLALLPFAISILLGNSILWAMAATALATRWPGAAVALAGKPLLLPFALPFVRRSRSWVVGLGVAAILALVFLPFWPDYVRAMRNEVTGLGLVGSILYFFPAPLLALVPIIPWLARTRGRAPSVERVAVVPETSLSLPAESSAAVD